MNNLNYIDEINSIKRLSDRFEIVHSAGSTSQIPSCDKENFCIADYKVIMCTQNTSVMDRSYTPFYIQSAPKLTEEEKLFIEQHRIKQISGPLMAGYYCDVFCNAQEKRNSKYVSKIIENYLYVVSQPDAYFENDFIWIWKSLIYNSKSYKHRIEDVLEALGLFLASEACIGIKYKLLINAYKFEFINANKVFSFALKHSLQKTISDSYDTNSRFFNMLLHCAPTSEKKTIKEINLRLAENEDIIIRQHPIDRASASDLLKKAEYLKNAGLTKEAEECYKLFIQAKCSKEGFSDFNYNLKIPTELLLPFINLLKNAPNPIEVLAESDDILPPVEDGFSLLSNDFQRLGIAVKMTDINGNPHPDNGKAMRINYKCFYNIITLLPITMTLKGLIAKKAFSEEKLIEYLNSTWLAEPRMAVNPTLSRTEESWIDSIRPALHLLNVAVIHELEGNRCDYNEYMCPIDSLTVKIEGCLRDVCRKIGISTVREDNHNELPLEEILNRIAKYQENNKTVVLSSRTINMLKKLLTNDELRGSNLRNDIAHGFTNTSHYTMETALTVIHCVLRVSSIKFPNKN